MILNRIGDKFEYEGLTYVIGAPIMGTPESEYEGLYGTITEIRDGEDKETENETPDIYCSFEVPALPCEVKLSKSLYPFGGLGDRRQAGKFIRGLYGP